MDTQMLQWLAGALLVPAFGWLWWVATVMTAIKKQGEAILKGQEAERERSIARERMDTELAGTLRSMVHYMKWFVKEQTGKEPPPPEPEIPNHNHG